MSAINKKFDPHWNTEGMAVQTTEEPLNTAPLEILVEIVLTVWPEATVVAQNSSEYGESPALL